MMALLLSCLVKRRKRLEGPAARKINGLTLQTTTGTNAHPQHKQFKNEGPPQVSRRWEMVNLVMPACRTRIPHHARCLAEDG